MRCRPTAPTLASYVKLFLFHFCFFFLLPILRHISQASLPGDITTTIKASRKKSQMKLVRMTAMSIAAFLVAWLPYTAVSMAAIVKGGHVLSPGEAEIPELMAKMSVILNPIVYTAMNAAYRESLCKMISGGRLFGINTINGNPSPVLRTSVNSASVSNQSFFETSL